MTCHKMIKFVVSFVVIFCLVAKCTNDADNNRKQKKNITILGPVADPEVVSKLKSCFIPFEKATNIKINYQGTKEFENLVYVRVKGDNPPDMAMFPQPGFVRKLAKEGKLIEMNAQTIANIKKNFSQGWIDFMKVNGKFYGVAHRVNIKSVVWYPKKAWDKAGWQIPKTWDELKKLSQDMAAKGTAPWALGLESGAATGWPATDWIEDIVLRTAGPEKFDQWVRHEIPFNHPDVKKAVEIMAEFWFTKGYVYGGKESIPTTHFGDAPKVLFDNPPKAWMYKQGNFITTFFPKHIQNNLDDEVGFFLLPPINEQWGTPILGGGDVFVAFKDRPEIHQFMRYLTTAKAGESWAKKGGALFAYKDQNLNNYPDNISRKLAEELTNAKIFRFDGSDLMPSQVGAWSFWKEMVNYVTGKELDQVLNDIEQTWPKK